MGSLYDAPRLAYIFSFWSHLCDVTAPRPQEQFTPRNAIRKDVGLPAASK
jgi:hypothetical protein